MSMPQSIHSQPLHTSEGATDHAGFLSQFRAEIFIVSRFTSTLFVFFVVVVFFLSFFLCACVCVWGGGGGGVGGRSDAKRAQ